MKPRGSNAKVYQIAVGGGLDTRWSDWFDGFTITPQRDGVTLLTGPIVDQAALYGMLTKIRDLGLPLLTVSLIEIGDGSGDAEQC
jgi:hypothetical protein